jgi:HIV Tat-specific factor 1
MKEASVELAVQLLDKSQIRPEYVVPTRAPRTSCGLTIRRLYCGNSWPIDVSPAEFKLKGGEFVKRKKLKIDTRAKVKLFEKQKVGVPQGCVPIPFSSC